MENPILGQEHPQILSPCSSGRRSRRISTDSNSPEFEFWMVRNPSFPQPNIVSADQLFANGILLPLRLVPPDPQKQHDPGEPEPVQEPPVSQPELSEPDPGTGAGPELSAAAPEPITASKRWTDIFKKSDKKISGKTHEDKEKEKKKEKRSGIGASSAELKINIWPFSRSRSAGNGAARPRMVPGAPGTRKVSSAPCSRSNSAGESKSRKWPSSPGRPGVHLGRSSPIWQVRRGGPGGKSSEPVVRSAEKGGSTRDDRESRRSKVGSGGGGGAKGRVLNVNVPTCIGYRHHLSCRSDENSAISVGGCSGGGGGGNGSGSGGGNLGSGGNLFNLRSLFTKKVY